MKIKNISDKYTLRYLDNPLYFLENYIREYFCDIACEYNIFYIQDFEHLNIKSNIKYTEMGLFSFM